MLNDDSRNFILAVAQNLQNMSQYRSCQFRTYRHNISNDSQAIEITRNGNPVNLFIFYPSIEDSGKIGSIAIYGSFLNEYYRSIKQDGTIFGIKVESIERDAGFDDFLDIYLDY